LLSQKRSEVYQKSSKNGYVLSDGYVLSGLNCLDLVLRSGISICDRNCEVQLGRKKNSKKLRCYMSAPVFVDTHPLEQLFNEIGVRVDNAMAIAAAGQSIASVVRTLIQDADFVCGVFPDEGEVNPNVAMEIGMAIGMGRPVFMIKEGDQPLPMSLMDFSYVKSAPDQTEVIKYHLQAFIKNMESSTKAVLSKSNKKIKKHQVPTGMIKDLRRRGLNNQINEIELTHLIAKFFTEMGAQVTVDSKLEDGSRPDIVFWLNDVPLEFGAPIIAEIKRTRRSRGLLKDVAIQIENYLQVAQARVALVITLDETLEIDVLLTPSGYIFGISLSKLLVLAEHGDLFGSLMRARNEYVHSRA